MPSIYSTSPAIDGTLYFVNAENPIVCPMHTRTHLYPQVNMAIIPHSYYSIHFLAYCHAPQNAWRDFIFKNRQVFKVCLARLSAIKMLHKRQQQNLHPHYLCPFKYAHDVASTLWMRYWWQAMLEFNCTFIKLPLI